MKKILANIFITFCGLVTTALTIVLNFLVSDYLDTNLYTYAVAGIVPVGAILVGAIAASGYLLGSGLTNTRPHWTLLLQMVAVAALANAAIYFIEWQIVLDDNGSYMSFLDYMRTSLTEAHYRFGSSNRDLGEVGQWGYALAALNFLGFLFGGVAIWLFLKDMLYCAPCQKYLKSQGSITRRFENAGAFRSQYDGLVNTPASSMLLASLVSHPGLSGRPKRGVHELTVTLYQCPGCTAQTLRCRVKILGLTGWSEDEDLKKAVPVPARVDLKPAFAKN
ncbi:MAG: hypothetical protein M3O22_07250 [Pseudomonadota bacterium]|nr:hypothetical protein [Pseudomonadota bacterium]